MRILGAVALAAGMLAWGASPAQAQITVNMGGSGSGNLTFVYANPTTGAEISNLVIPTVGGTAQVAVYLKQTGGTVGAAPTGTGLFSQLGSESLGVRLVYNNPAITRVPSNSAANITANAGFDFLQRGGSTSTPPNGPAANNTTDTSTNAALVESLLSNPVVFPGAEDPTGAAGNAVRILVGTFTLTGLSQGTTNVIAEDPFTVGNNNLTGPNPTSAPPDGAHGEVMLDQFLTDYKTGSPSFASLSVIVGVPEPGTMALCGVAAAGFAAWRRRRATAIAA
jgi:hypothetical protein